MFQFYITNALPVCHQDRPSSERWAIYFCLLSILSCLMHSVHSYEEIDETGMAPYDRQVSKTVNGVISPSPMANKLPDCGQSRIPATRRCPRLHISRRTSHVLRANTIPRPTGRCCEQSNYRPAR